MLYLFALIAIITLALVFFAQYFSFHVMAELFGITGRGYFNFFSAVSIFLPLIFILASFLIQRFNNIFVRLIYLITATWFGLVLYLFLASLLAYTILFLTRLFSFNLNGKLLGIEILVTAVVIVIYGIFAAQNIKIKELNLTLPNLPAAWQGKTAVYISDLHLGVIDNFRFAERIAERINDLHPDLLFIGGDFFDGQKNVDLDALAQIFGAIETPNGKFFVTGNHEQFGDDTAFINTVTNAGITNLNNQLINLNGLQIVGVDYRTAYSKNDFAAVLKKLEINKNQPSILLRHVPDKISVAEQAGISLMLSGHAHKGQLSPIQLIEILFYDGFQYGLKNSGATNVYTSSGAGTWGPPMRILADPEIVKIKFK